MVLLHGLNVPWTSDGVGQWALDKLVYFLVLSGLGVGVPALCLGKLPL